MAPRVLIFSAAFGAGHIKAAEAVIEAIQAVSPGSEIIHLDCGELISKRFNSLLKGFYIRMLKSTPRVWGRFYKSTSNISDDSLVQSFLDSLGQNDYLRYIQELRPDLIICTYPTIAGVLAKLRKKKALDIPLATVVTDYSVHSQWIHSGVDLFIVGCADVARGLIDRGIEPERIKVTGIPVNPRFESSLDRNEVMARLGLRTDLPTVLVMGGAYGVLSELKTICRQLADSPWPVQTIVVCGRDKKLFDSLEDTVQNARNTMIRFGFVNNVAELMTAANLVITKAGGLTVSEALTRKLPLVIFKPIPGQEEANANFVARIGAGRTANNLPELEAIVNTLLREPEQLEEMRRAAASALPGNAAIRAAEYMLQLVGSTLPLAGGE
ncbi:MAG: glycosyltransferase [Firmicutes bacterium]|nr:glycosyltransferase [Bacillota bacterium]